MGQMQLFPATDRAYRHFSMEHYIYKPKERNLDYDRLIRRLGDNFDSDWMSVNKPTHGVAPEVLHKGQVDNRLANKLSRVNFSYVDDNGEVIELSAIERHAVEKWLLKRSSCEVHFSWADMTEVFWPRWIKNGFCDNNNGCSWPPGMRCVPAKSRPIKILNWQCGQSKRKRKERDLHVHYWGDKRYINNNSTNTQPSKKSTLKHKRTKRQRKWTQRNKQKRKCRWNKVRYQVTTECYCTCL